MTEHKAKASNLPVALSQLDDALHQLINPQTDYRNNETHYAPSLYTRLRQAVHGGDQTNTGNGGGNKSRPPIWTDAHDLLNEIDRRIAAWCPRTPTNTTQPKQPPAPPTITRLRAIQAAKWRPQDIPTIDKTTATLTTWTTRINTLLDPEHIKHVSAPCPACGATTIYRKDSADETIRQPALQLITSQGCTCQKCHAHWAPEYYTHLCRVLGFDLPAGVLE